MTNNSPSLLVAVHDRGAVVKIKGRANFTTSVSFKRLMNELCDRGFDRFILDLGECVTMDSTFLGVLAGSALRLAGLEGDQPRPTAERPAMPSMHLLNPNQRVSELLDNLGVSELFKTIHCDNAPVSDQDLTPAQAVNPSREELSQACLEAHQILMELNPQNVARFKDVTQFLAEDLKRSASEARKPATDPNNRSLRESCSHGR